MSISDDSIQAELQIPFDETPDLSNDYIKFCKANSKISSDLKTLRSFSSFETDRSYQQNEIQRRCHEILCPKPNTLLTIWEQILQEDAEMKNLYDREKEKKSIITPPSSETYFKEKILNTLIPATDYSLSIAKKKKMYKDHKQVFNGIDAISEFLLNIRHACHLDDWQPAYFYFQYKWYAYERPIYPLHWILTRDQAATIIQSWWRRYWVRKHIPEIIEFWKAIKAENWKPLPYSKREEAEIPAKIRDEYKLF